MSVKHLHAALDRAKERHKYAQMVVARARTELNSSDPLHARSIRKIEEDLANAERDLARAINALDQARDDERLNL